MRYFSVDSLYFFPKSTYFPKVKLFFFALFLTLFLFSFFFAIFPYSFPFFLFLCYFPYSSPFFLFLCLFHFLFFFSLVSLPFLFSVCLSNPFLIPLFR
ncbi:hypothetical protein EO92_00335 [Methanosarcina sp. 2.H.A.1B.4]|nr:hypothetical protein EO92_00335 [Methanosarcina sp. 2.H.A.1B.4]